jgi:hypothetical protein
MAQHKQEIPSCIVAMLRVQESPHKDLALTRTESTASMSAPASTSSLVIPSDP